VFFGGIDLVETKGWGTEPAGTEGWGVRLVETGGWEMEPVGSEGWGMVGTVSK
jgi:hypothetical protein